MAEERGFLDSWTGILRRRWRTGAAIFAAVLLVGIGLLFLTRPVYRAEAALRLGQPPPPSGVSPTGGVLSLFQVGGDPFANDLELLGSRTLAEEVVERVALNAALKAPRGWHRDSLLFDLRATRGTDTAVYAIRRHERGYEVRRSKPSDSIIGTFAPATAARFGGLTVSFRPWRDGAPEEFEIRTMSFAEAARRTRSALDIQRPRREANVVALGFNHTDPGVTEAVLAASIDEFMRLRTALQERESGETVDSLRTVARSTASELRSAEDALEAVQRESRLVSTEAQSEALVELQTEVVLQLRKAEAELAGVEEMLRRVEAAGEATDGWTALLSYPAFLESQTLGDLLTELTRLQSRRQELATRRGPENRELRVLDDQIAYLERSLRQVAREYRTGLEDQIAALRPQVAQFDSVLESLPAQVAELARAEREVRLLTEILVLTEQRLRQEELREALTYANVQVVDPAALRDRPVWPRKMLGLAVALFLAGGFALGGMVVRDRTDSRLRRVTQLRAALDRPVLAVLEAGDDKRFHLSAIEADVLMRRAGTSGNGRRLTLVPVQAGAAAPVAVPVAAGAAGSAGAPDDAVARPDGVAEAGIVPVEPVRDFADAAEVAAADAPVALVVESGRTRAPELRQTARLIEEAGGTVVGVVLVCRRRGDARAAWT